MPIECLISFDNNSQGVYYAGQELSGVVDLTVDTTKRIKGKQTLSVFCYCCYFCCCFCSHYHSLLFCTFHFCNFIFFLLMREETQRGSMFIFVHVYVGHDSKAYMLSYFREMGCLDDFALDKDNNVEIAVVVMAIIRCTLKFITFFLYSIPNCHLSINIAICQFIENFDVNYMVFGNPANNSGRINKIKKFQ